MRGEDGRTGGTTSDSAPIQGTSHRLVAPTRALGAFCQPLFPVGRPGFDLRSLCCGRQTIAFPGEAIPEILVLSAQGRQQQVVLVQNT